MSMDDQIAIAKEELKILIDETWAEIEELQKKLDQKKKHLDELHILLSSCDFNASLMTLDYKEKGTLTFHRNT
jgi:hypothetical protein